MKNRKLKKPVVYGLYVLGFIGLCGILYTIEVLNSSNSFNGLDNNYVNKTVFETEIPVVNTSETIIEPYIGDNINIVKNFYDYKAEASAQEKSLLYFENTYLQNSGISYGSEDEFNVVAILDGTVTSVKDDQSLGKIIEITHNNDLISIYQSLGEINVTENQEVKQGDIIGKSGTCNIESDLNKHLHFELIAKGMIVNPSEYYDKKISEL